MIRFVDFPQETHPERIFAKERIGNPIGKAILDLGCGNHKTITEAIGVDIEPITDIQKSIDDLGLDKETIDIIITRHSIEHLIDPIKALQEWKRVLKKGGKIIFILPDHENVDTMDKLLSGGKHMHAYTRDSFSNLIKTIGGFKIEEIGDVLPNWSFGGIIKKI